MNRVLFVDEDKSALDSLRVVLHPMRATWDMSFTPDGQEGLRMMEAGGPFDIVVTELRMPIMPGTKFLREVMKTYPLTVRFVLSGDLDEQNLSQAAAVAHQVLAKPCDAHRLREVISRVLSLKDRFDNRFLKETLLNIGSLPSVPVVYTEVMREIQSENTSMDKIGKLIQRDPGMSAKVLQIVNSAHMGLRHKISSITHACTMLGMQNIKAFVLFAELFASAEKGKLPKGFSLDTLWNHGLTVGGFAKHIAEAADAPRNVMEDSYTAGLMHDIGLLILASQLPDKLVEVLNMKRTIPMTIWDAEKRVFGATHADIGGYLLDLWGLPDSIVGAITYHYYPSGRPESFYSSTSEDEVGGFDALTAVHVANFFCEGKEAKEHDLKPEIDAVYLERLGLSERVDRWYDVCFAST